MRIIDTDLPEVKLIEPKVFGDERGYFFEAFHKERYTEIGLTNPLVQDNVSKSQKGVLRGLHFQNPKSQGKLVSVLEGEVFDVAVDIRPDSPNFKKWVGFRLSAENKRQLWVPRGFAHGFVVTSKSAIFAYKCDEFYAPEHEYSIAWNDPEIAITWPVSQPSLSGKDAEARSLSDFDFAELPQYE